MEVIEQKKLSPSARKELKIRILEVSDSIPENYKDLICALEPEYDTPEGRRMLANVKALAVADEKATKLFEFIGREYREWFNSLKKKYQEGKEGGNAEEAA